MIGRNIIGLLLFMAAGPLLAQQPAATEQGQGVAKPERKICKRSAESGSLIETRRECHTRKEWDQIAQTARAAGQEVVDRAAIGGH